MNPALTEYFRVVAARWRWVAWGVLIALGATTIVLLVQPGTYRTAATVFVRTPGDTSLVVDGGDLYAQGRAKTYAALAASPSVSARVIADLGLDLQPETLAGGVTAKNPPGTALIDLTVDAPTAAEAQRISIAYLTEYAATVRALESVPGALVPRAELVVVDPPGRPIRVSALGVPAPLVLSGMALIGLVLGATAAVLRYAFGASAIDRSDTPVATEPELPSSVEGDPAGQTTVGGDPS